MIRKIIITLAVSVATVTVACAEDKPNYTDCLNTELFQVIKKQVHLQLEKSGLPDKEGCDGLTYEQLQGIDWSEVDLSQFIHSAPNMIPPEPVGGCSAKCTE